MTAAAHGGRYRRYARVAAAAFLLVTVYSVAGKVADGRLGHDWLHSVLHVVSAAVAVHAGWWARTDGPARLLTMAVGVGYTLLGVLGWFVPGFFLHGVAALPLDAAANVFHLGLGVPALALVVLDVGERHARVSSGGSPGR